MAIFDFIRRRVAPTKRAGVSGVATYGGYLVSNESKSKLIGEERYKTYSEIIANVSIVASAVRLFLNMASKAAWKVEPAEDSGDAGIENAEKLQDILFRDLSTPWHRIVRRAAMYRFYGFSIQEWTAQRRPDGSVGLFDIEPRPQNTVERWDVDEAGIVSGVIQRAPQDSREIYIPRSKLLYLVDDSLNDTPEGLGLFRHLVDPASRLQRYEQLEGIGFETDLRGIPVGRAPLGELKRAVDNGELSASDKAAAELPMRTFLENHIRGRQTAMLLDSSTYRAEDEGASPSSIYQWAVELLTGSTTAIPDIGTAIQRVTREIARVVGVEHLLLGETGAGSLALSRDKSETFALVVSSTLEELTESIDSDVVKQVAALNGWSPDTTPTLKTDAIQHRSVEEITGALKDLATAGLQPDDPAINEVRDLLGLSRPIKVELDNEEDASL